ncbi:MAG: hypothetical protein JXB49_31375 [Bacteroidales bacterium]|nr:hypothetical protein [Bacteroidales bacterium]
MKFFLPYIPDSKQAEVTYIEIKTRVSEQMHANITTRRIFSIDYERDQKKYHIEIGQIIKDVKEIAFTIFECANMYYVCTSNRGVVRGMPLIIDNYEIRLVTDFEE